MMKAYKATRNQTGKMGLGCSGALIAKVSFAIFVSPENGPAKGSGATYQSGLGLAPDSGQIIAARLKDGLGRTTQIELSPQASSVQYWT